MSMKVDRVENKRIYWGNDYENPNSEEFQVLEGEASYAIDSAMALTSFSNLYVGNNINKFFSMNGKVTVNASIELTENGYTKSELIKRDIKRKLIEVIQARNNNIGNGNLYVNGPFNPIPGVEDFNECSEPESNDCGRDSECVNEFGGFSCVCSSGYGDKWANDRDRAGRQCDSCSPDFCNNRGVCSIQKGEKTCECTGNFYGPHCGTDGEVVAVAIGASVAAVIIIILTLICLCMWSQRWKRDQQKSEIMRGFPRAYMAGSLPAHSYLSSKIGAAGPYHQTATPQTYHQGTLPPMDNAMRWAHHLDNMQHNIYAQPEPVSRQEMSSRRHVPLPSIPRPSTSLGVMRRDDRNPAPLIDSSESEDNDMGKGLNLGRPRSRASIAGGGGSYGVGDDDFHMYGVRNPRLVAAVNGQFPYQPPIQMNLMGRWPPN